MIIAVICVAVAIVAVYTITLLEKNFTVIAIKRALKRDKNIKCMFSIDFFKLWRICFNKKDSKKLCNSKYTNSPADYGTYKMKGLEILKYVFIAEAVLLVIAYIFFKNIYICAMLSFFSLIYPFKKKKDIIKRRKAELNIQFKDALYSLSSSLSAGKSVEGAFKAALADLRILYPGESTYIIKEFELINRKIEMNETVEEALQDFALRADIDDITNFMDVFIICKSSGGNLIEVIKNTSNIINMKIDARNEIEVIIAQQKFSQKILNIMPFYIMGFIMLNSPDYIEPLYSPKGNLIMLVVLFLLTAAYIIGSKIADIKV